MREETARILRLPFAVEDIDQLPRTYHRGKPDERTVQLDYVGHATATARLLDADLGWTWEPFAIDEQGLPRVIRRGDALELWIRLTIDGTTKPGVGTVPVEYDRDTNAELPADQDTAKELIGDAIRNAAMRFGVALDLWRKHGPAEAAPTGPPCPHCQTPVAHNPNPIGGKPIWSCPNRSCAGGDPARPRKDGTLWPWASWLPNFFAEGEEEVQVHPPIGPAPEVPADAFDDVGANLQTLGISEAQARAEIETMAEHPGFAAGTLKEIRGRVGRAIVLCVALNLDGEGLMADLWKEWQSDDAKRQTLTWSTCRSAEVPDFARHVQSYLRATLV